MRMLYDVNVWVALLIAQHVHHERAREHFATLDAGEYAFLTQIVRISVLRILTTPALHAASAIPPITNTAAFAYLTSVLQSPKVRNLTEPPEVFVAWKDLAQYAKPAPNRWMDAYLCAIARHAGVPLVTFDTGMVAYGEYGVDVRVLG